MIEMESPKFGPILTFGLIPSGFTHHPDICPVASAPVRLVPSERVKNRGVGEYGTGMLRPAERMRHTVGLVAMVRVNGVVVIPFPRFSRVGIGR